MYSQKNLANSLMRLRNTISKLTEKCNDEPDVNKKIELLYRINSIVPKPYQLKIPSLLTDDYINTAMYRIYQTIRKIE